MSTKAHFIYANGIEGYQETSEPRHMYTKFVGYDSYLMIDFTLLNEVKVKSEYIEIYLKKSIEFIPESFQIHGSAILEFEIDSDGIMIHMKAGFTSERFMKKDLAALLIPQP